MMKLDTNPLQVRDLVKSVNHANDILLHTIEAAALIICLDDESPSNPTERYNQLLYGDVSNRWSDKSLQFVVCANGVSGFLVEHAMLDAGSLHQLNEAVTRAILDLDLAPTNTPSPKEDAAAAALANDDAIELPPIEIEEEHAFFATTSTIDSHIARVQRQFAASIIPTEYNHFAVSTLGAAVFRAYKCAPKTGCQLLIQLASRLYFGNGPQQPPSWETVSLRTFRRGRVDLVQYAQPLVAEFCEAACAGEDEDAVAVSAATCRRLFFDAARACNVLATRVSRGHGFVGHLYALREVLRDEDEEIPSIFTDPIYEKTKPGNRKLMTDYVAWSVSEGGFMEADPENVWVHYEVDEDA